LVFAEVLGCSWKIARSKERLAHGDKPKRCRPVTTMKNAPFRFPKAFSRPVLAAALLLCAIGRGQAQTCSGPGSATCYVQYQVSSASGGKCQVPEYESLELPRVHVYLHQTTHGTYSENCTSSGNNAWPEVDADGCTTTWSAGAWSFADSMSIDLTLAEVWQEPVCTNYSQTWSGHDNWSDVDSDSRQMIKEGSACGYYCRNLFADNISQTTSPALVTLSDGSQVWECVGTESGWVHEEDCSSTNITTNTIDLQVSLGCSMPQYSYLTIDSPTHKTWSSQSNPGGEPAYWLGTNTDLASAFAAGTGNSSCWSGQTTAQLDTEYTDADIYNNIVNIMPAFAGCDPSINGWYVPDPNNDNVGCRIAYSIIDPSYGARDLGYLQKMQYQFAVPDSQGGVEYFISWDLVTWDLTAGTVNVSAMSTVVLGTGDPNNPVLSGIFQAPAPFWHESTWGGMVVTWVDNVSVSPVPLGNCGIAGSGPYGPGGGSGCSSCGGASASTGLITPSGSISAAFGLGPTTNGLCGGSLQFSASQPSLALATPAALWCSASSTNIQVIKQSGQIRQVMAPQALVDVVTDSAAKYELDYYLPSQFSSQTNSQGLYTPQGSPTPFVVWTVQNPDSTLGTSNGLVVTETRGTSVNTYTYTYNTSSGGWTVDYPGGLREDTVTSVVTTNNAATTNIAYSRVVTTTIGVPGGPVQFESQKVYQQLQYGGAPAGNGGQNFFAAHEYLVQETLSPNANPQTTTYSYYATGANGSFRPLALVVHPDGSWTYYDYTGDESDDSVLGAGRVNDVYSGFGDEPVPSYWQTVHPLEGYRQTQFYYDNYSSFNPPPMDDPTQAPYSPRLTREYLQPQNGGAEIVSQSFLMASLGERDVIRCATPGAQWNDSSNLVTVTKFYTSGPNSNRVQSVLSPDGTMTIYQYAQAADGRQTNTVSSGQPNSGLTAIIDGTTDVTVLGPLGQSVSHTVFDVLSGIVLAQDVWGNYDSFSRPQQVTHLDGTTELTSYDCCGVASTTDRDGVVTTYAYDAMKRLIAATRLGVTSSKVLDAYGHVLQEIRTGTNGVAIVTSQSQYDLAGRLVAQTNALLGVTTISESSDSTTGALIRTTTNPDGGTRVEAHYLDGSVKQVTGTAVHPEQYVSGWDTDGPFTIEIKVASDGTTNEWTKSSSDLLGRPWKALYPDGAFSQTIYNILGQTSTEVDPDGVSALYAYNGKGEQVYSAVDMNQNGAIDFAGTDRITFTTNDVVLDHSTAVRRTRTYVWPTLNSAVSNLVSVSEASANGLQSWQVQYRDATTSVTNHSVTGYGSSGARTLTTTAADGSYAVNVYSYGQAVSVTRYDSTGAQLGQTTYGYDGQGHQSTVTDARNGATTYTFNNADQIVTTTTPAPGTFGDPAQTTTTSYDTSLRAWKVVQPDGSSVTNVFLPTGEMGLICGSRTYPVGYSYDYGGRMKTMTNWSSFASQAGPRVTAWNYDPQRGWLTGKQCPDGQGPSYSYTDAGKPASRRWARTVAGSALITTYAYDTAGALASVAYSDSTPGVTYTCDRLGRQTTIVQGGITTTLAYSLTGEPLSESYSGGPLDGLSVTNGYDSLMRRSILTFKSQIANLGSNTYAYDAASRLATVSDGTGNTAGYTYLANSPLVSQITFTNSGALRMSTTKSYDYLNRLTHSRTVDSQGNLLSSFGYQLNSANQRTRSTMADGSYWVYTYDNLGQVIAGNKYWADGTPVAGQQFDYAFDDIGNRIQTAAGGDQNGNNLRVANYHANLLNQYTNRDFPGFANILGSANSNATITVWGTNGTYSKAVRYGQYYRGEIPVNNSNGPVYLAVTNLGVLQNGTNADTVTTNIGNMFFPQTPETFAHDADGNLTQDGRWTYTWDGENRLINMTSLSSIPAAAKLRLDFAYDARSRRTQKIVSTWNGSTYVPQSTNLFLYDGWNLVAELRNSQFAIRNYMWGLDLSGSIQGAGGVGGLLASTYYGAQTTNCFAAFDGNGNVAALISAADSSVAALYEYGPFGELLRATGPMAHANAVRFSTKYQDDETGVLYYCPGRYRSASWGGWLSRDPMEEQGGLGLYGFVGNNALNAFDPFGFDIVVACPQAYFLSLGLEEGRDYKSVGENLWRADPTVSMSYAGNLDKEIIWEMLSTGSERVFTAKDLSVDQLAQQVRARKNVISEIANVHWTLASERTDAHFNPAFWSRPWILKPGANASDAVNDLFGADSAMYTSGCNAGSMFVLLKGIEDTIGASQFNTINNAQGGMIGDKARNAGLVYVNVLPKASEPQVWTWVAGDRGWIMGTGSGIDAGQWLIYEGLDRFWGFGADPAVRSLDSWIDDEGGPDSGVRYYPGVGLEKPKR